MSGREEGLLARWSRRKREAAVAPAAPAPDPAPLPPEPGPAAPDPGLSAPEPATPAPRAEAAAEPAPPAFDPASLPPVESLTRESDITAFLRAEVPAALRQAALRRIWSLDPAIRDFVGPADYAWDYNAPDGVPGFALSLGGDVKRLLAQAIGLEERHATARAEAPSSPEQPPPALAEAEPLPPEEPPEIPALVAAPPEAPKLAADLPVPPRRHGKALPT